MKNPNEIAKNFFGTSYDSLDDVRKKVTEHIYGRKHIAKDTTKEFDKNTTVGQRAADAVAAFGGSWTFIILFATILIIWVVLNSLILVKYHDNFDPYPYILLNLFLSMLAAIQAPIILMSQNRQAEKDRINAEHDYEVNLKAELEIMMLHEKIDMLREKQWLELMAVQTEQIKLLGELIEKKRLDK
jgi:uncharacterized membrane protein